MVLEEVKVIFIEILACKSFFLFRYALPKKRCKQKVTSKRKETQKPVIKNDKKTSQKIHESTESVNKNRVTLPYYKQFSRETLLPSESLRRDLEQRIEQIC